LMILTTPVLRITKRRFEPSGAQASPVGFASWASCTKVVSVNPGSTTVAVAAGPAASDAATSRTTEPLRHRTAGRRIHTGILRHSGPAGAWLALGSALRNHDLDAPVVGAPLAGGVVGDRTLGAEPARRHLIGPQTLADQIHSDRFGPLLRQDQIGGGRPGRV